MPHIHTAAAHTGSAMIAPVRIHLHADDVETIEETVDRTQRAQETAEAAIAENARQHDHQHNDKLPGKKNSQHVVHRSIGGIGQMTDRTFRSTCRTDIFAEARKRHFIPQTVPQGNGDHKHRQYHVFQPGQCPGDGILSDLRYGNFMQKLLNQSQRAEPSADGTPQNHAVQKNNTQHIPAGPVSGGGQGILDRSQRAGAHCAGT